MSLTTSSSHKRSNCEGSHRKHGSKRTKRKTFPKFAFHMLPPECQLLIFSFLNPYEKCEASLTCRVWAETLKSPCLWRVVDFTDLLGCEHGGPLNKSRTHAPLSACSTFHPCPTPCHILREKVERYVAFLCQRKAQMRSMSFEFDILEESEHWLHQIMQLLGNANSGGLEKLFGRWAFTPHFQMRSYDPSLDNKYSRVLSFHKLLCRLAEKSPRIKHFRIQFDWSMDSVELLCRFQQIHTLELSKYWVFVKTPQTSLDALLNGLPNLRRLRLEMVTPFQHGVAHLLYTMRSPTLEELDIRRSSGFFLSSVNLPRLKSFSAHREYWAGPVLSRQFLNIPCLHGVLRDGAPSLGLYNGYPLNAHWREQTTIMLEEELKSSCYCPKHKKGDLFF